VPSLRDVASSVAAKQQEALHGQRNYWRECFLAELLLEKSRLSNVIITFVSNLNYLTIPLTDPGFSTSSGGSGFSAFLRLGPGLLCAFAGLEALLSSSPPS
jgi:hypothetical protein